jgi:AraC family transcriptional regulator
MVKKLAQGAFFGRTHSRRAVPGITLMESLYGAEVNIPPHEHATAFFDYVLEGFCSEVVHGQSRQRGRATLAFHPAGEVHANRWLEGAGRCFHIEIGSNLLDRVHSDARTLDRPISFAAGQAQWLALRLYDEFRRTDEISALVIEALTLELLAEGVRLGSHLADRKPPRWLRRVRDLLHEEFRHRLRSAGVAAAVGLGRRAGEVYRPAAFYPMPPGPKGRGPRGRAEPVGRSGSAAPGAGQCRAGGGSWRRYRQGCSGRSRGPCPARRCCRRRSRV